jgi:predicted dehydrogenase
MPAAIARRQCPMASIAKCLLAKLSSTIRRSRQRTSSLATLRGTSGLVTAVGLQARVNPAVMHVKELIEAGFVGEVMAVHVSLLREGVLSRPSHRTWQRDAELGAHTLTIATGHKVDAMRFVTGDFRRLSAMVATQPRQWLDTGTNTLLDVTSPDNMLLSGQLLNGAVVSVHIAPSRSPAAAVAWKSTAATEPWSRPARTLRS